MKEKMPANEALRKEDGVIDQRNQQIDPAGKHRVDVNENSKRSQKQPGQDLRDPQADTDSAEWALCQSNVNWGKALASVPA